MPVVIRRGQRTASANIGMWRRRRPTTACQRGGGGGGRSLLVRQPIERREADARTDGRTRRPRALTTTHEQADKGDVSATVVPAARAKLIKRVHLKTPLVGLLPEWAYHAPSERAPPTIGGAGPLGREQCKGRASVLANDDHDHDELSSVVVVAMDGASHLGPRRHKGLPRPRAARVLSVCVCVIGGFCPAAGCPTRVWRGFPCSLCRRVSA